MEESKNIPIVVCMIVKNEEALLARCLETVKGADAIYIADTGSVDKTVEIAKKYTKNVFTDYQWKDNFAEARNHVLSKVKEEGAWILSIDADEFLETPFDMIRSIVKEGDAKAFKVVDIHLVSEKDGQVHSYPRLFKKDPAVYWLGVAHNHISMLPQSLSTIRIVYGYSPAHQMDPDRTVRILEAEVKKTGNPRETYYLAREYWYRARYKDALDMLLQYLPKAHFLAEKADAFLTAGRCYYLMGMLDEARNMCVQALIINSHFKEAAGFMATLSGEGSGDPAWEENAQQWRRMADTANNNRVLFRR